MYKILLLIILLIVGYAFLEGGIDAALKQLIKFLGIAIMISWLAFCVTVGALGGFHLNAKYGWFIFPLLAIWTGMRKSEISALQWGDMDLEAPVPILKISRTLEYSNGERRPTIKTPKSKAGSRDIPLTIEIIAALRAYRAWQAKIYWKAKRKLTPDTTLIFNDAFGLVHKSVPQHRWEALLKSAGVRHRSLHKLRHTFTSKLIRTKMRLDYITSIVGHADERTTTQIYSHFFDGHKKKQLEIIQGMLNR